MDCYFHNLRGASLELQIFMFCCITLEALFKHVIKFLIFWELLSLLFLVVFVHVSMINFMILIQKCCAIHSNVLFYSLCMSGSQKSSHGS